MLAQAREVRTHARKTSADFAIENRLEALAVQRLGPFGLVEEQAQFGGEADVGERDVPDSPSRGK